MIGLKRLDTYIIKKFLGTYVLTITLIISIVIMVDVNSKIDYFIKNAAPLSAIIFDYYLNFVPYIVNMFSPLFVFIAVIFFTSKLADNSEVIAILSSGVSFNRLMRPYLLCAAIIAIFTFALGAYIIPKGNIISIEFQNTYVKNKKVDIASNIQSEVEPGVFVYLDRYYDDTKTGHRISLDHFDGKELKSRLTAQRMVWDSAYHWTVKDYMIRDFDGMKETIRNGSELDTIIKIIPSDFLIAKNDHEKMTTPQLIEYIDRQKNRGIGNIQSFEIELHNRFAVIFAAFILTIIGASLSARKIKGGMGLNIGIGLVLSFSYILFMRVSSTFAISGLTTPFIAAWIPNFVYTIIAIYLYRKAPK